MVVLERLRPVVLSLALLGLAHLAFADPPARVGCISHIGWSVSFRPASADEWAVAARNYPLTVGDHLWTARGGRAELALGWASSASRTPPNSAC